MAGKYQAVLVEIPANWEPSHEMDIPIGATLQRVIRRNVSTEYARSYNTRTMREHGRTWVVLVRSVVRRHAAVA